eukprot:c3945_g1_i1.p1 GENE.c3945_g1_i1~~c3945_g1_i1.p1  ORF type:complete len:536 (-),score=79.04 c3945_g1_i1:143-1528(-)
MSKFTQEEVDMLGATGNSAARDKYLVRFRGSQQQYSPKVFIERAFVKRDWEDRPGVPDRRMSNDSHGRPERSPSRGDHHDEPRDTHSHLNSFPTDNRSSKPSTNGFGDDFGSGFAPTPAPRAAPAPAPAPAPAAPKNDLLSALFDEPKPTAPIVHNNNNSFLSAFESAPPQQQQQQHQFATTPFGMNMGQSVVMGMNTQPMQQPPIQPMQPMQQTQPMQPMQQSFAPLQPFAASTPAPVQPDPHAAKQQQHAFGVDKSKPLDTSLFGGDEPAQLPPQPPQQQQQQPQQFQQQQQQQFPMQGGMQMNPMMQQMMQNPQMMQQMMQNPQMMQQMMMQMQMMQQQQMQQQHQQAGGFGMGGQPGGFGMGGQPGGFGMGSPQQQQHSLQQNPQSPTFGGIGLAQAPPQAAAPNPFGGLVSGMGLSGQPPQQQQQQAPKAAFNPFASAGSSAPPAKPAGATFNPFA